MRRTDECLPFHLRVEGEGRVDRRTDTGLPPATGAGGGRTAGQRLILTGDLLERKRRMIEEVDGFVALPGDYGTLDEVLEAISMRALGVLSASLVLVNVDEAWNPRSSR